MILEPPFFRCVREPLHTPPLFSFFVVFQRTFSAGQMVTDGAASVKSSSPKRTRSMVLGLGDRPGMGGSGGGRNWKEAAAVAAVGSEDWSGGWNRGWRMGRKAGNGAQLRMQQLVRCGFAGRLNDFDGARVVAIHAGPLDQVLAACGSEPGELVEPAQAAGGGGMVGPAW
jgi:hypothetical protein